MKLIKKIICKITNHKFYCIGDLEENKVELDLKCKRCDYHFECVLDFGKKNVIRLQQKDDKDGNNS